MESLFGTNKVKQIGVIVKDIEKTSKEYANFLGLEESEIIISDSTDSNVLYKGYPTDASCKLAFYEVGKNIIIELLQPVGGPSVWQDFLNENGEGVHHITMVPALEAEELQKNISNSTFELLQVGDFPGGCYKYYDTRDELKIQLNTNEFADKNNF